MTAATSLKRLKNSRRLPLAAALLVTGVSATGAHAANLVQDGTFTQTTSTFSSSSPYLCTTGTSSCVSALSKWSVTLSSLGAGGSSSPGSLLLAGTNGAGWNGNRGLYAPIADSQAGGNAVAIDGDPTYAQTISQSISGLIAGNNYTLSFYQAAGQQKGLTGATTEQWKVSLGSQTFQSTNQSTPSQGTSPWIKQTLNFTATAATEVLSFFAQGTPGGAPPTVLLAGVDLQASGTGGTNAPAPAAAVLAGGLALAATRMARRSRAG